QHVDSLLLRSARSSTTAGIGIETAATAALSTTTAATIASPAATTAAAKTTTAAIATPALKLAGIELARVNLAIASFRVGFGLFFLLRFGDQQILRRTEP